MKRLMAFIAAIIILMNMAACASNVSTEAGKSENTEAKPGFAAEGSTADSGAGPSLNIYYMMFNDYVHNAISEFKNKFSDVNVNEKKYEITSDDEFIKSLSTELLTGGGPDVVICNPLRDIDSISKFFSTEAFADLNDFISKDKDFKLADYNSSIINTGIFNGRREFLPIYFSRQLIYTTESVLEKNNIDMDDNCSLEDLTNVVDSFLQDKERKSKYLFNSEMNFYYMMNYFGSNLLDYKNRKSNFNSSEFKKLLRLYKNMQMLIAPVTVEEKYDYSLSKLFKNRIISFYVDSYGSPGFLFMRNCFINDVMGEEIKVITATAQENRLRPILTDIAAINNNCINKEYAYEFIKILLSEEIQKASYSKESMNTFMNPVNNIAFLNDVAKLAAPEQSSGCLVEYSSSGTGGTVQSIPLSEALVKHITSINNNMAEPVFIDKSVKEVIDDALKDYLSGKSNEDQTAMLINDKIELFLNE